VSVLAETLLTEDQAAERLQVPARELRAAIAAGALAHVRIGKHVRIHPADLDDFVQRHRLKAWEPPKAVAA
jgi:excisionase family DNA binding protein